MLCLKNQGGYFYKLKVQKPRIRWMRRCGENQPLPEQKSAYVFCRLCECYFILVHLQIKSIALSNSIWQNHYFGASEIFAFNLFTKVALSVLLSLLRMLCFSWENHVQTEKFMCKTEKIAYKTENEIRWKVLNRGLRSEKHFQSCFLPTMH